MARPVGHGAGRPMNVCVRRRPNGAWSTRRCPRGGHPVVLAMFVLTEVSSMKASLSRWSVMKGRRFVIRMWRRSATSLRFCSRACRSCFMRRPESVPRPPNRGAVDRDAMGLGRVQHKFIECDPALRANTGIGPIRHSHARRHCPEVVGVAVPSHAVVSPGHSRIPENPKNTGPPHGDRVPIVDIGGNTLPHLHLPVLTPHIRLNTKRTASQAIRESSTSNTAKRSRVRDH